LSCEINPELVASFLQKSVGRELGGEPDADCFPCVRYPQHDYAPLRSITLQYGIEFVGRRRAIGVLHDGNP
jgi:hypothetical protein